MGALQRQWKTLICSGCSFGRRSLRGAAGAGPLKLKGEKMNNTARPVTRHYQWPPDCDRLQLQSKYLLETTRLRKWMQMDAAAACVLLIDYYNRTQSRWQHRLNNRLRSLLFRFFFREWGKCWFIYFVACFCCVRLDIERLEDERTSDERRMRKKNGGGNHSRRRTNGR